MIKFFQTLCLLFLVTGLSAQKAKLKDFKVKANHVNLPTIGFSSDVTTYDCTVDGEEAGLNRYGFTFSDISSRINIKGYNKVDGGGSASVTVTVGRPIASTRETLIQDKVTKDKKKYKLYNYYFDLSVVGTYKVVDNKGNIISEQSMPKKERLSTPEFKSLAALKKHYADNYPQKKTDALTKLTSKCISDMNNQLNREFSVGKMTSNVFFEGLKSKDHPDYKAFQDIKKVVEGAFGKMTSEDNSAFVEAIQPAIKFWTEKEPGYSTKDKHAKKLNYACRRNTAIAYLWVEDFDNAIKYASMIENGDYNEKKGKRLKERIEGIQTRMEKLNLKSRHFAVKVSEEDEAKVEAFAADKEAKYASGDISQFPEFNKEMGVKLESRVEPGKLFIKGGNVDEGYFVYESDNVTPDFREPRKIRFGKNDNGSIIKGNPKYSNLDSLQIGEKMYRIRDVQIGEGLISMKLKNAIIENVQTFNRTRLEISHPPFKKARGLGDDELVSSLVIWHNKKKKHFSPDGLSFTKSMKKAIGDCGPAMDYVNEMKAKNKKKKFLDKLGGSAYTTEDLLEILRLYDECK